ncbi:hypothetical protein [Kitasatospora sp. NPDC050543]|uniref:hypothetical protein n=1 Tax=Kitasatospora sp. NPDC050543 TaxID=3364054 RepID=UPI0037A478F8
MRAGPGQVLSGRYRVTDRPQSLRALAVDERTGGDVLLRGLELPGLLTPGEVGEDPSQAQGERLVARVAGVAQWVPGHPRLLQGRGVFVDAEVLWTVEEHPGGGAPLADLAQDGPVPPYRVAELAADLAGALRALHEAGLTHGNVSADSVLVCEDGAALLGGLLPGVAQEALCEELGGPGGRRRYEVRAGLLGAQAERWPMDGGAAGDCWALGVLMFRLLTGHGPYPQDDLPGLLAALREDRREPAEGCGPLRPLVERLLQGDPGARPTAVQVRQELTQLLAGAPEPYGPPSPVLLPVPRPAGPLVVRQRGAARVGLRFGAPGGRAREEPRERSAAPRASRRSVVPPALLGPLLVAGVLVALLVALAAVVLFAG